MANTTIRNEKLFCLNCGGEYALTYPMAVEDFSKKTEAFNTLHSDCEKTWTEPQADQNRDVTEKAMWWIGNGHVGMSSKTMWNFFMGNKDFDINHPYDPDDFSRCYKLLEAVPEWKKRILELGVLSKPWKNLSENWDKLTEMYEQNQREEWKNYKEIGMYEFMDSLIS